jgi:two-component system response regulator NreC
VLYFLMGGISAYVLKGGPLSDLILALKAVKCGGTYFSTMAPTILLRHIQNLEAQATSMDSFANLSRREREIFCLLADGKPVQKVAGQLDISSKTVETHKYNIMKQLGVHSMVELTKIGIKKQLIKI